MAGKDGRDDAGVAVFEGTEKGTSEGEAGCVERGGYNGGGEEEEGEQALKGNSAGKHIGNEWW